MIFTYRQNLVGKAQMKTQENSFNRRCQSYEKQGKKIGLIEKQPSIFQGKRARRLPETLEINSDEQEFQLLECKQTKSYIENIKTMKNQGRIGKVAQSDVEDQKGGEGTQQFARSGSQTQTTNIYTSSPPTSIKRQKSTNYFRNESNQIIVAAKKSERVQIFSTVQKQKR